MNTYLLYVTPPLYIRECFDVRECFLHCTVAYFKALPRQESFIYNYFSKHKEKKFAAKAKSYDIFDEATQVIKLNVPDLVCCHQSIVTDVAIIDPDILNNKYFGRYYQPHISYRYNAPIPSIIGTSFCLSDMSCMRIKGERKVNIF